MASSSVPSETLDIIYAELQDGLTLTSNKRSVWLHGRMLTGKNLHPICREHGIFPDQENYTSISEGLLERHLEYLRNKPLPPEYEGYTIGLDLISGEYHVLDEEGLTPWDFQAWKALQPEEIVDRLMAAKKPMTVAFDPHKGLSWEGQVETTTGPRTITHYNCYIKAPWQRTDPPTDYSLVERDIPAFLELFIPDEKQRAYAIWWLYKLSEGRCQDVPILQGVQGNGKNTFMELAKIVAGRRNSIGASKSFGKEKFNSEVLRRKLVCLDEYRLQEHTRDSLKCWTNNYITVEAKGVDAYEAENHCSFILANNSKKAISIEFKDRRFTCFDLGPTDMVNKWPEDRVARLQNTITHDKDFEIQFPHWVRKKVEDNNIEFPVANCLKTPKFYDLVESSKPTWARAFKYLLTFKDKVTARDIKKQTGTAVSDQRIQDFIQNETEERRTLKKVPHVICDVESGAKAVVYKSNILQITPEETDDDED